METKKLAFSRVHCGGEGKKHAKFDRKSEQKIDMCVLHGVHNPYYGHQ